MRPLLRSSLPTTPEPIEHQPVYVKLEDRGICEGFLFLWTLVNGLNRKWRLHLATDGKPWHGMLAGSLVRCPSSGRYTPTIHTGKTVCGTCGEEVAVTNGGRLYVHSTKAVPNR